MKPETTFIDTLIDHHRKFYCIPQKLQAEAFVDELFQFLFLPQTKLTPALLQQKHQHLQLALTTLLIDGAMDSEKAVHVADQFCAAMPGIYLTLLKDAEALLASDPAARSLAEIIIAYPGFYATAVYRLSHQLWQQGLTLLPRLFCEFAHSKTGIDIHPGARIGHSFAIDHGTGIVIGETSVIGNGVKLYQGVTLGALSVTKDKASSKRHPTIEDEVIIYSGATILGGETTIGKGSVIGGNVWLTYSVPSNSVVYHTSEVKIKDRNPFPEPINYVI
jgi:serine O-acetyltransferase